MKPTVRVRSALLMVGAVFAAAFGWSAAQGQVRPPIGPGMRPPPIRRPPGFPNTGPRIVNVWTCSGCGKEIGRGLTLPPDTCPHCGARIINGVGGGIPQPGMGGRTTPPNPGINPAPQANPPVAFNPNPQPPPPAFNPNPPTNPPVVVNPPPPVRPVPPVNPAPAVSPRNDASTLSGTTSVSTGSPRNWKLITIVIGIITLGVAVLLGGTFLVIYTVKNSGSGSSGNRRRPRRDDYD